MAMDHLPILLKWVGIVFSKKLRLQITLFSYCCVAAVAPNGLPRSGMQRLELGTAVWTGLRVGRRLAGGGQRSGGIEAGTPRAY